MQVNWSELHTLQNTHHTRHKENNRQVLATAIKPNLWQIYAKCRLLQNLPKNTEWKNMVKKTLSKMHLQMETLHKEAYRKWEKANGAKPPYHWPHLIVLLKTCFETWRCIWKMFFSTRGEFKSLNSPRAHPSIQRLKHPSLLCVKIAWIHLCQPQHGSTGTYAPLHSGDPAAPVPAHSMTTWHIRLQCIESLDAHTK